MRLRVEQASAYAPALLLLLALPLGGLRSPGEWTIFAFAAAGLGALLPGGLAAGGTTLTLLFFAWMGAAAAFSPFPASASQAFAKQALCCLLFCWAAAEREGEDAWLYAVYAVAALCGGVLAFQALSGAGAYGLIGRNPNYSAAFCAAAFPAAALRASGDGGHRGRAVAFLLLVLAGAGVIFSGSRGAAMGALLSSAAGLALTRRWKWLAGLAVTLAAAVVLLPHGSFAGFLKLSDPRAFARADLWKTGLQAAWASPLLGWGPGSFQRVFELFKFPYFDGYAYFDHSTLHAHSEIVNLAAEGGFPAAVLFISAAAAVLLAGGRERLPVKLCAVAVLMQGAVDIVFYSGAVSLLFWGSLGFAAGPGSERRLGGRRAAFAALCAVGLAVPAVSTALTGSAGYLGLARTSDNPALRLALAREDADQRPRDPFAAAELGGALAAAGDMPGAEEAYIRALSLEPGFAGARLALAGIYAVSGLRAEACSLLSEPWPPAAPEGSDAYRRGLAGFDKVSAEKLKKDVCEKTKSGGATARPRRNR